MRHARLAVLILMTMAVTPAPGSEAGGSVYILDREGRVFAWQEGEARLRQVSLPWESVDDLAPFPNGHQLLVLAQEPGGAERRKREGLAAVMEASGAELRLVRRVRFEGRGLRAIVAEGGQRAYLLAFHPPPAGSASPTGGRSFIHEVDLDTGKVLSSVSLAEPVLSIVAGRGGRRIYVGIPDRILSYETSPLTTSWYLRSPGPNLGLYRPGQGSILYAVRGREVALFDPKLIDSRSEEERRKRTDDATTVLALADQAGALLFNPGDSVAAVYGGAARLGFLNSRTGVTETASIPGIEGDGRMIRPIAFTGDGSILRVAILPDAIVSSLPIPPGLTRPVAAPAAMPSPDAAPAAAPAPTPPTIIPAIRVIAEEALRGVITGDQDGVAAIVIYGPESLIKEHARVLPGPDGTWEIPLPPPGTYRILPIGRGSSPIRSTPNFQTVTVKAAEGLAGIDFRVEAPKPAPHPPTN